MAKDTENTNKDPKVTTNILVDGMSRDTSKLTQPQSMLYTMLNGTEETSEGDLNSVSNYPSNELCAYLPDTYVILGHKFMVAGDIAIIAKDTETNLDVIGIFNTKECSFEEHQKTHLNLQITHQIDIVYRLRLGCERTIYFTDNYNVPRYYNFDRPEIFEDSEGNFDVKLLGLLYNNYIIPKFKSFVVEELGQLPPGAVVVGVQYVDNDENTTHILTMSKKIEIYADKISENISNINGTSSIKDKFNDNPKTTKSIRVILDPEKLDKKYNFYRLIFIHYQDGTNSISGVYRTQNIPIKQEEYTYSGFNNLIKLDSELIQTDPLYLSKVKNLTIYDDRLILSNVQENDFNFCLLQKHASKIRSHCVTRQVDLYNINDPGCPKKPNHLTGYMPGDIYSFGIVYIFSNGMRSPVYHIPGKNPEDTETNMADDNICANSKYTVIKRNSCEGEEFWGTDVLGQELKGKHVRHHRFPTRKDLGTTFIKNKDNSDSGVERKLLSFVRLYSILAGDDPKSAWMVTIGQAAKKLICSLTLSHEGETKVFTQEVTGDQMYVQRKDAFNWQISWKFEFIIPKEYAEYNVDFMKVRVETEKGPHYNIAAEGTHEIAPDAGFKKLHVFNDPSRDLLNKAYWGGYFKVEDKEYNVTNFTEKEYNMLGVQFSNIELPPYELSDGSKIVGYEIVRQERTFDDRNILDTGFITPVCKNDKYYTVGSWNVNYGKINETSEINRSTQEDEVVLEGPEKLSDEGKGLVNSLHGFWNPLFYYKNIELEVAKLKVVGSFSRKKNNLYNTNLSKTFHKDYFLYKEVDGRKVKTEPQLFRKNDELNNKEDYGFENLRIVDSVVYNTIPGFTFMTDITEDIAEGTTFNPEVNKGDDEDGFRLRFLIRESNVGFNNDFGPIGKEIIPLDLKYLNALSVYELEKNENEQIKVIYNITADSKIGYIVPNHHAFSLKDLYYDIPYIELRRDINEWYSNFREAPFYKETNNYFDFNNEEDNVSPEIYSGDIHIGEVRPQHSIFYKLSAANRKKKKKIWEKILGGVLVITGIVLSVVTGGSSLALTAIGATLAAGFSLLATGIMWDKMVKAYKTDWDAGVRDAFTDNNFVAEAVDSSLMDGKRYGDDEIRYMTDGVNTLFYETTINTNLNYGLNDEVNQILNYGSSLLTVYNYGLSKLTSFNIENKEVRGLRPIPYPEVYQINPDYEASNYGKIKYALPYTYDCCSECLEVFPHRRYYSQKGFEEEITDSYKIIKPNNYNDMPGDTGEIMNTFVFQNKLYFHTIDALWMQPANYQEKVLNDVVAYVGTGEFFEIPPQKILDSDSGHSFGLQHKWSTTIFPNGYLFVSEEQSKIILFNGKLNDITKYGMESWFYKNIKIQNTDLISDNPANIEGSGFISCYYPKEEKLFITKIDKEKSWTISFSLKKQRWRSFHSFIPTTFLIAYDLMYSWKNGIEGFWKHGVVGKYQEYYNKKYPFIIEYYGVANMFHNFVYDFFRMNTEAYQYIDGIYTPIKDVTFDEILLTTEEHSSGVLTIVVQDLEESSYFDIQNADIKASEIFVNKKETDWYFNEIRNYREDYTKPIYKYSEDPVFEKEHDDSVINFNKNWEEVDMLSGKYLKIRLVFKNKKDYKLIMNFINSVKSYSLR